MRLIEYIFYTGNGFQKFGKLIGYDRNYIAKIAKGEIRPTDKVTQAILEACRGHVTKRELMQAYELAKKLKQEKSL